MKVKQRNLTIKIGYENAVMINKIIGIFDVDSNPIKKMITDTDNIGMLIDCTKGKTRKSAICVEDGYIILSPVNVDTLLDRLDKTLQLFGGEDVEL